MIQATITVLRSRKALSSSGNYTFYCGAGEPVTFCLQVRTAQMMPHTCHQLQRAPEVNLTVPSVISSSNTSTSLTCKVMGNPAPKVTWILCQRDRKCVTVEGKVTPTDPATNVSFTSQLLLSPHFQRLPDNHVNVTCLASNSLGDGSATSPLTLVDYLPPVPVLITWCLCFACSDCSPDSRQAEEDVTLTAFSSQKLKVQCSAAGGQDEGWSLTGSLNERVLRRSWSTDRSHTHLILIDKLSPGHAGILHCHGISLKLDVTGEEDILSAFCKQYPKN